MQLLKNVGKVVAASLQDLQQETNGSKDCGEMSFVVFSICFIIYFRALEDEQWIAIENPVDMLALCLAFLRRINQASNEFKELHNNHPLRMEGNWTPNQVWLNGMLNQVTHKQRTSSIILLITQNFMKLTLSDLRHSKTVTIMLLSLSWTS